LRPQVAELSSRQLKGEIMREPLSVPFECLIESFCRYSIEASQVGIKNHALIPDDKNQRL
jgi:hypothetical protein